MSRGLSQRRQMPSPAPQSVLPSVIITGDLQMVVSEADAVRGPITGSYRIETQDMQEPLLVLWDVEGQVLNRQARATAITFDLSEMRARQRANTPVQVPVSDRRVSVVSGVFVQLLVAANAPLQQAA